MSSSSNSHFGRRSPRWIAMDSDGCVLNTMEPKHRRCFTPALIQVWGLQEIEPLAREGFLELNLYSKHRGVNRFLALHLFWQWLAQKTPGRVFERLLPSLAHFEAWVQRGDALSESSLTNELLRYPDDVGLQRTLHWSQRANALSQTLPPAQVFAGARPALNEAAMAGHLHVVSGGNGRAIQEEWRAAGLDGLVHGFHTQENGSKTEILLELNRIPGIGDGLMIGDSPGDAEAAQASGMLFFPIVPGQETECWEIFCREILPAFLDGRFTAQDSQACTRQFHAALIRPCSLPTTPPLSLHETTRLDASPARTRFHR